VETFPLNTAGAALGPEMERVCIDNELVIATWSPIHLRNNLNSFYWKADKPAVKAADFWDDTLKYLYLPRLRDRGVLAQAIVTGAGTRDFFGTACGLFEGKFEGFKLGDANVQFDDTLLLIQLDAAKAYEIAHPRVVPPGPTQPMPPVPPQPGQVRPGVRPSVPPFPGAVKAKAFHGNVAINPSTAKIRFVQVAEEIIAALAADPNAEVKVSLEIQATFPNGAQDQTKRAVSENAKTLGFKNADWE